MVISTYESPAPMLSASCRLCSCRRRHLFLVHTVYPIVLSSSPHRSLIRVRARSTLMYVSFLILYCTRLHFDAVRYTLFGLSPRLRLPLCSPIRHLSFCLSAVAFYPRSVPLALLLVHPILFLLTVSHLLPRFPHLYLYLPLRSQVLTSSMYISHLSLAEFICAVSHAFSPFVLVGFPRESGLIEDTPRAMFIDHSQHRRLLASSCLGPLPLPPSGNSLCLSNLH